MALCCGMLYAQSLKTFYERGEMTCLGEELPYTETFTYYLDNNEDEVLHGTYKLYGSSSRADEMGIYYYRVNTSLNVVMNFKNGALNGQSSYVTAQTTSGGPEPASHNESLYISFKEGVVHGAIKFVYSNVDYDGKQYVEITTNVVDGKYRTGAYKYYEMGVESLVGNFDYKGLPAGRWVWKDFTEDTETQWDFVGGVAVSVNSISEGVSEYVTPTAVKQKGSQFAAGTISLEKLMEDSNIALIHQLDWFTDYDINNKIRDYFPIYLAEYATDSYQDVYSPNCREYMCMDISPELISGLKQAILESDSIDNSVSKIVYEGSRVNGQYYLYNHNGIDYKISSVFRSIEEEVGDIYGIVIPASWLAERETFQAAVKAACEAIIK